MEDFEIRFGYRASGTSRWVEREKLKIIAFVEHLSYTGKINGGVLEPRVVKIFLLLFCAFLKFFSILSFISSTFLYYIVYNIYIYSYILLV